MDPARLQAFERIDNGLGEARYEYRVLAEIVRLDAKSLTGSWIRKMALAIDDFFDALAEGKDEVVRRRVTRERAARATSEERTERKPKPAKQKRSQRSVADALPVELSRDPSSVPGAIRCVLADHPEGLPIGALVAAVIGLRPGTERPSISSALTPMVRRREVARHGFHRNYIYILVRSPSEPVDVTEGDISEKEAPM